MKKTLITLLLMLSFIGISVILGVFTNSMLPSDQARSKRSHHVIKNIMPGSFMLVGFKRPSAWQMKKFL